jgi:tetratricopeptide (TPR) repeat protein
VYNALGEALYRTGEASEAEEWFKEALKKKPDHIPAHLTYGKMLARNVSQFLSYFTSLGIKFNVRQEKE